MTVHPAIRIVLLVVFAVSLARLSGVALALAAAPVAGMLTALGGSAWRQALVGVYRLRWLLLSILLLYLGFDGLAGGDWAGALALGAERCFGLALMIAAVRVLLQTTPTASLTAGLLYLARPLAGLGLDIAALARRIAGAAQRIELAEAVLREARSGPPAGGWLAGLGTRAAEIFAEVERRADRDMGLLTPSVAGAPPRWHEWLYPMVLGMFLVVLGGWRLG